MNLNKSRIFVVLGLFVVSFLFWLAVFSFNDSRSNTGSQSDRLSGLNYNKTAINSDRGPNPNAPYFVGFNVLTSYGVLSDDMSYIKDVIVNDTLYRKKLIYAKVSFVKGSFSALINKGLKTNYGFQYGLNGGDIQTIRVVSNLSDNSIEIKIIDDNQVVFSKKFIMYSSV